MSKICTSNFKKVMISIALFRYFLFVKKECEMSKKFKS